MKLLEEIGSSPSPRPSGKRVWLTMSATLLVVIIATYFGYSMVTSDGAEREIAPVSMTTWTDEASAQCKAVAEEYPVLTQGADVRLESDNIKSVAAGIQDLDTRIRELPPLTASDEQNQVNTVVALGEPASSAWEGIESNGDASKGDLSEASERTSAFVAGLVDIGADCAVLN